MPPTNRAAWVNKLGDNIEVREAPYISPNENEIVIKTHAWAINPVDWVLQERPIFDWIKFPVILGYDIAGEVVEVGSAVTRFKASDRVLAMPTWDNSRDVSNGMVGGFQDYVVIKSTVLVSPIPESMSYAEAAVFPLCLSTAACALFQKDFLALQHPSVPPKPTGKTILVWGGSSAVGTNGIQLAVAAGYNVIATASPNNAEYLKKLGAKSVFDYKSTTIIEDLVSAINNETDCAGIFHAAGWEMDTTFKIAAKLKDKGKPVFIASAVPIPEDKPSGIEVKMVWADTLKDNEVGPAIFEDFLPRALAGGSYVSAPAPWVVGHGLESVQVGFDIQKKGVSAKKVVIVR